MVARRRATRSRRPGRERLGARSRIDPLIDPIDPAHETIEDTIETLIERTAAMPDRGGNVDVVRALRHLELPRGPLDRWLASAASASFGNTICWIDRFSGVPKRLFSDS